MSNVIKQYEKEQIKKLTEKKEVSKFRAGDTVRVSVRVSIRITISVSVSVWVLGQDLFESFDFSG